MLQLQCLYFRSPKILAYAVPLPVQKVPDLAEYLFPEEEMQNAVDNLVAEKRNGRFLLTFL
jgi:hypothetical protein